MRWTESLTIMLALCTACGEAPAAPPVPDAVHDITVQLPATAALMRHDTVRLSAQAVDASGKPMSGARIEWTSLTPDLGEVDAQGLFRALAPGEASVRAAVGAVAGTVVIPITEQPAPEPGPGATIRWRDEFDSYTTNAQISGPYATRGSVRTAPGRSGNGVIFEYTAAESDNLIERTFPATTDIYIRYWFRTSPGADPSCNGRNGSGFKWFMAWREGAPRYTMGVSMLDNGGPGSPRRGLEFTTHDNSSQRQPNPFLQNVSKAKRFDTVNDGQWHKYTLHIVTGNGGYEQVWIDDLLVLDNRRYVYDHSPVGISMVNFPGNMVSWHSGCEFSITIDDLVIWAP